MLSTRKITSAYWIKLKWGGRLLSSVRKIRPSTIELPILAAVNGSSAWKCGLRPHIPFINGLYYGRRVGAAETNELASWLADAEGSTVMSC